MTRLTRLLRALLDRLRRRRPDYRARGYGSGVKPNQD